MAANNDSGRVLPLSEVLRAIERVNGEDIPPDLYGGVHDLVIHVMKLSLKVSNLENQIEQLRESKP